MNASIAQFRRRAFRLAVLEILTHLNYGRAVRLQRDGKASGMWNAVAYMHGQNIDAAEAAKTLARTPVEAFEAVEGGA